MILNLFRDKILHFRSFPSKHSATRGVLCTSPTYFTSTFEVHLSFMPILMIIHTRNDVKIFKLMYKRLAIISSIIDNYSNYIILGSSNVLLHYFTYLNLLTAIKNVIKLSYKTTNPSRAPKLENGSSRTYTVRLLWFRLIRYKIQ